MSDLIGPPPGLTCEAKIGHLAKATHIYGPECEAETGNLKYLCAQHAAKIQHWINAHMDDPVICPTHGLIGKVRGYVILKEITNP